MDRSQTVEARRDPARRTAVLLGLILAIAGACRPVAARAAQDEAGDLKLAHRLLNERLYAQAAEEYERVLRTPKVDANDRAEATFGLANAALFLNRLPEARKQFQEFLRIAPRHQGAATAWFRVGELAYLLGDLKPAREALETYTARYPDGKHLENAWPYLGDICLRLSDLPAAESAYRQALTKFPDGRLADRSRCGLARTLAGLGRPEDALRLLSPLAEAPDKPFADQARFLIGQIHANAGRLEPAVAAFERLERDVPRSPILPEARLAHAGALNKLGRRDDADELLRRLIAEAPRNLAAQAALDLATSQLDRDRPADARVTSDDALKRFEGAPAVPPLMFRSGEAAARAGQAAEARTAFLKMAALFPNDPWADDALLQVASLALKAHDQPATHQAVADLLERYPQSPHRPNALLIDARAWYEANRSSEAIAILEPLLKDAKASPEVTADARYHLGLAYRKDGQKDKAARILDDLAKMPAAPGAGGAQFLVGQAHIEAGRHAEAVAALDAYLAAQPDGELADVALSYLVHANLELDRPDVARAMLARLEARFPRSKELVRTYLRVGESALKREQYAEAIPLLSKVADGDDPAWRARGLSGLGWAQFQSGRAVEAAATFGRLVKLAPDDALAPEAAFLRGRAFEAAGQADEASKAYAEAIESYPRDKPSATAALARARLLADARSAEAAEAFELYLKQFTRPGDDGLDSVLADWGASLLDAKQTAAADVVFRRLVDDHPASPHAADARLNLAVSASEAKEYDAVDRYLGPLTADEAQVDPEIVRKALFLRGRTLAERQDWAAAEAAFDRLAARFPDAPERGLALFWKGEVAYRADRPGVAESAFAALLNARKPGESFDWLKTAGLRRLQCLVQLERWDEAIQVGDAFRATLPAGDGMIPEVEYLRGRSLQTTTPPRFAAARTAYDAALAAEPPDELAARAELMKGETYFFEKDYTKARRSYLKVATTYDAPRWQAAGFLQAAKVYERLDQWAEAAELYERVRTKFAAVPEAAESVAEAAKRHETARRKAAEAPANVRSDDDTTLR